MLMTTSRNAALVAAWNPDDDGFVLLNTFKQYFLIHGKSPKLITVKGVTALASKDLNGNSACETI
eukprot:3948860-Pleurochrysis_carterae.AAC.1